MAGRLGWAVGIAALLAAPGCAPAPHTIHVDVRTDLAPGIEFSVSHVDVFADGSRAHAIASVDHAALAGESYLRGQRVADLPIADGDYDVHVVLLGALAAPVVDRVVKAHVAADLSITVVLTRSCRGVTCAASESCVGGRCVSPTCTGAACMPECTSAATCTGGAACASPSCVDGACFYAGVGGACPSGDWCNPDTGCEPLPGATDAGPTPDAGSVGGSDTGGGCRAGATRTMGCGNCGTATSTCRSDGTWGGYGACMGEGCHPGDTDTSSCSEGCNTYTRTCQSDCSWGPYGDCTGGDQCPCTTCRYCIDDQTYDQCHLTSTGCLAWEGSMYTCLSFPGTHCSGGFCVGP
jgi:hypothetical protein